jgi:hypothetical protein
MIPISDEAYAALVERFGDIIHETEGLAEAIYAMEHAETEKAAKPRPVVELWP